MIDLHLHTSASDGALSASELVLEARAAGLLFFSVTDHDTTAAIAEATRAAAAAGLECIPGIEISAVADGRDVHVLGYFFDVESAALKDFLRRQRDDRLRRVGEIGDRLAALGVPVDVAPILAEAARGRSVGRPQLAAALLAAGHVATRDEAFDRFLEFGAPAFVPRCGPSPRDVVRIIHDAGGIASLAHPGLTRCDPLIPELAASGLDALEVRHPEHDAPTEARYRGMAAALNLLVTAGSDFHGADTGHGGPRLGTVTMTRDELDPLRARAERR